MTRMDNGWVRRIAHEPRVCDNCDDVIYAEATYFLMLTGERFCWQCPPEEADECPL